MVFSRVFFTYVEINARTYRIFFAIGDKGNFYKICGFVFRVLFCQPASWMPSQKNYQRVLTATWAMSLFILAQGYSGTLVSMFTAPSFHIPINR